MLSIILWRQRYYVTVVILLEAISELQAGFLQWGVPK